MNEEETKFYSIGRGNLNIDGKFYYGLDYTITDFMRSLQQERNNYKELYEKEKENWNELREDISHVLDMIEYNKDVIKVTSDEELAIYSLQDKMQEIERL